MKSKSDLVVLHEKVCIKNQQKRWVCQYVASANDGLQNAIFDCPASRASRDGYNHHRCSATVGPIDADKTVPDFIQGRDLLLLIPGVDGLNMEVVDQFDILSTSFDVWSMRVEGTDKSTFVELTEQVDTDRDA